MILPLGSSLTKLETTKLKSRQRDISNSWDQYRVIALVLAKFMLSNTWIVVISVIHTFGQMPDIKPMVDVWFVLPQVFPHLYVAVCGDVGDVHIVGLQVSQGPLQPLQLHPIGALHFVALKWQMHQNIDDIFMHKKSIRLSKPKKPLLIQCSI